MNSLRRIFAILQKEIRQLSRDRLTFGMIIGIPLIQIALFGYAINTDVRHLRAAVADESNTEVSRTLAADAQATQVIDVIAHVHTAPELETLLRDGDIDVGIYIPSDYARRLQQRDRSAAQLLVDGSDPIILSASWRTSRSVTTPMRRRSCARPCSTSATISIPSAAPP